LLSFSSLTIAVTVKVDVPSATIVVALVLSTILEALLGVKVTIILELIPPAITLTVAVPVVLEEVKVAVAIPFSPVLLDGVIDPKVVVKSTVVPFTGFPLISFTIPVILEVEELSAVILVGLACSVILAGEPAIKVTDVEPLALPAVAVMVAVPIEVDDVKVVVATPLVVIVNNGLRVPFVVLNDT